MKIINVKNIEKKSKASKRKRAGNKRVFINNVHNNKGS